MVSQPWSLYQSIASSTRKTKIFLVESSGSALPCPLCGGPLHYRDSRRRIMCCEGGGKEHLLIRRLQCAACNALHNELPDCLTPYKHYRTETISGVLDGLVTPEDEDSEDYPCEATMARWLAWFLGNLANIEGHLRRTGFHLPGDPASPETAGGSLLSGLRDACREWLEILMRILYNSGGSLPAYPA